MCSNFEGTKEKLVLLHTSDLSASAAKELLALDCKDNIKLEDFVKEFAAANNISAKSQSALH